MLRTSEKRNRASIVVTVVHRIEVRGRRLPCNMCFAPESAFLRQCHEVV